MTFFRRNQRKILIFLIIFAIIGLAVLYPTLKNECGIDVIEEESFISIDFAWYENVPVVNAMIDFIAPQASIQPSQVLKAGDEVTIKPQITEMDDVLKYIKIELLEDDKVTVYKTNTVTIPSFDGCTPLRWYCNPTNPSPNNDNDPRCAGVTGCLLFPDVNYKLPTTIPEGDYFFRIVGLNAQNQEKGYEYGGVDETQIRVEGADEECSGIVYGDEDCYDIENGEVCERPYFEKYVDAYGRCRTKDGFLDNKVYCDGDRTPRYNSIRQEYECVTSGENEEFGDNKDKETAEGLVDSERVGEDEIKIDVLGTLSNALGISKSELTNWLIIIVIGIVVLAVFQNFVRRRPAPQVMQGRR